VRIKFMCQEVGEEKFKNKHGVEIVAKRAIGFDFSEGKRCLTQIELRDPSIAEGRLAAGEVCTVDILSIQGVMFNRCQVRTHPAAAPVSEKKS